VDRVFLHDRGLTALPDELRGRLDLTVLDVAGNPLGELPAWITELGALEILYAARCELRALPDLGALTRLRYLQLGENPLARVPDLSGLGRLLELRVGHNQLAELPALPRSLRELHARGNALSGVPDSLAGLPDLFYLDLRANRIADVPTWALELPALRKLDLRWNPLRGSPTWADALTARGCTVWM
jgi:Leucine-rich repeat (LRR) protein